MKVNQDVRALAGELAVSSLAAVVHQVEVQSVMLAHRSKNDKDNSKE